MPAVGPEGHGHSVCLPSAPRDTGTAYARRQPRGTWAQQALPCGQRFEGMGGSGASLSCTFLHHGRLWSCIFEPRLPPISKHPH